jgi:hypothetical protein
MLTDGINTSNILSCRPTEICPFDVMDTDRKVIMKNFIVVYGAIIFERHPENNPLQNFFRLLSLQGNPALLMPWMVYVIVSLIVMTILNIVLAAGHYATDNTDDGDENIIKAVMILCK